MFDEQKQLGGVTSRANETRLVADSQIADKPGFKIIAARSDISQLENVSEADAAAILSNSSMRVVFKPTEGTTSVAGLLEPRTSA